MSNTRCKQKYSITNNKEITEALDKIGRLGRSAAECLARVCNNYSNLDKIGLDALKVNLKEELNDIINKYE